MAPPADCRALPAPGRLPSRSVAGATSRRRLRKERELLVRAPDPPCTVAAAANGRDTHGDPGVTCSPGIALHGVREPPSPDAREPAPGVGPAGYSRRPHTPLCLHDLGPSSGRRSAKEGVACAAVGLRFLPQGQRAAPNGTALAGLIASLVIGLGAHVRDRIGQVRAFVALGRRRGPLGCARGPLDRRLRPRPARLGTRLRAGEPTGACRSIRRIRSGTVRPDVGGGLILVRGPLVRVRCGLVAVRRGLILSRGCLVKLRSHPVKLGGPPVGSAAAVTSACRPRPPVVTLVVSHPVSPGSAAQVRSGVRLSANALRPSGSARPPQLRLNRRAVGSEALPQSRGCRRSAMKPTPDTPALVRRLDVCWGGHRGELGRDR